MNVLGFLSFLEGVDFTLVLRVFLIGFVVFWLVVVGWVIADAFERTKSIFAVFFYALIVLVFNIMGLVIYLLIRPKATSDEAYWADLERRYLKFETAGLGDCPSCGEEIQPNFIFCPSCGYHLRVKCPSCGVFLEPSWNVCPFCSHRMRNVRPSVTLDQKARKHVKPEPAAQPPVVAPVASVSVQGTSTPAPTIAPTPELASNGAALEVGQSVTTGVQPTVKVSNKGLANNLILGIDGFVQSVGRLFYRPKKKTSSPNGSKQPKKKGSNGKKSK